MLKSDAAAFLAGVTQVEGAAASAPTNLHVITGEVGTTSEEGKTTISIDGLVFSEEDSQEIEIDTLGGLEEGDIATVILTGESGHGMTPLAIGAPGSVDRLKARVVETELLIADKADIEDLEAATARIGDLEADHVSVNTLEAATARIETLEVDHVSIADFEVEQANIDSLQAATADIDTIRANSAKVQNLTAAQLEADHATIGTLDTTYMHVNMANADVAWISNGTIRDGAIVSAMINDVSANKLTAGTINGSVINVTNLNADNITAGTINGQRIGTGSLSLDKLSEDVYTESEVNDIVDDLNDRIDAQIETWTESHVPTLNNTPASAWTTNDLKAEHVGDICYVLNAGNDYDGYTYRFAYDNSTSSYKWVLIKDNQVTAALGRLTTAEGKIEGLESFESTTSSWITQTDDDLTSVKSRTTTLEGSVQVAQTYYATCTTAAGTAAKVATITPEVTDFTLRTGTTVIVNFSATNSNSSATLNLNSTGAQPIRYKNAALTSTTRGYLAANRLVILKYDGTYWQITGATTDANTYDRTAYKASLTATAAIPAGTVGVIDANGKITALSTTPFDTSGPILYIGTAYTSSALTQTNNYSMYGTPFNLTTTKSGFTGTAGKPVYIVGTLNGRMFTPDSQIFTTTVPTQADGKQYILLGLMSTTTNATLAAEHPIFAYGPNGFAAMDYNNQQALSTKVETSVFNTLSQTVDSNTASITSLTTITENNGLTSSTNITNTVNTVSQTASGNSAKITQLTTTLGTNADGTTKAGDVVHRTSAVEQDLSGFKTTVSQTYATNTTVDGIATRVSTAESNITQNANNIALKVSESDVTGNYIVGKINLDSTTASIAAQHINLQGAVTISDLASDAQNATLNSNMVDDIYQSAQPNLSPFFEIAPNDATYWFATNNLKTKTTPLEDGWSHVEYSSLNLNVSPRIGVLNLAPSTKYTVMLEVRNATALTNCRLYIYTDTNSMWAASVNTAVSENGTYYLTGQTKADLTDSAITHLRTFFGHNSSVVNADIRLSLYEGEYDGPFKPYSGTRLFATQTDASNAAKTATSYVTEITGQNGIMVHPSTDQTTGVQITDSVNIMQDGVSVAEYGETARVGAENSAHSVWESGEFVFNDGTYDTMKLSAPESITETHVIPSYSSTSYYAYIELEYPPASLISVEVDNTEYTYTPTMTPYGLKLRKHEATFSGETVTVTYKPSPAMYIYDGVGDGSSNVATRINANKVSLAKDVFSISTAYDLSSGSIKGGDVRIGDSEASRSEIMLRYSSDRSYVTFQTTGGNRTAAFVLDTGTSSEPERSLDLIYLDKINYIDPYDNYKVLGRPTRLTANKSMTLTDTSGWTDGPSVDLTQGHWLVVGVAVFNTGSSSGVRKLRTQLRLGTSVYAEGTEINVANNAFGRVEAVAIMSASSDMTATLVLNSGMTFTTAATSYITAILLT